MAETTETTPAAPAPIEITTGVTFDTIAREWRCKWSGDEDKASLQKLQQLLDSTSEKLKSLKGVKSVQRIVCGGCLDFKVITALDAASFGEWEAAGFEPEKAFLEQMTAIPGVTQVETQTYTLMPV